MPSICTIARGRDDHLHHMIRGLAAQTRAPDELVIARMQETPYEGLPESPFAIRQVHVSGERAPLAAARNAAAEAARSTGLIFLDVDSIPQPGLVAAYGAALAPDLCLMGETRYLARDDDRAAPPETLWAAAVQHPARLYGDARRHLPETSEFWSLSFALTAATFRDIGGFDARFTGYGGEDTDFAQRLGQGGVRLVWLPEARAVHQWHPVSKPPLGHFDDILRNATLFHCIHGRWCMDYWLDQLVRAGYIDWQPDRITVLRRPSPDERQAALCDGSVRFS